MFICTFQNVCVLNPLSHQSFCLEDVTLTQLHRLSSTEAEQTVIIVSLSVFWIICLQHSVMLLVLYKSLFDKSFFGTKHRNSLNYSNRNRACCYFGIII